VNCASCGSPNRPGAKFCSECGATLSAACPTCGAAIDPAAKFCAECGTRIVPGATAAPAVPTPVAAAAATTGVTERRVVSVLFADLVEFTRLAEGRDPEAVREILSRYFDTAREVVGRYGGTIEKFIGDAVMAVWGAPVAHEDDAERAVRSALDLVGSVRALGADIGADLRLRAGVLTGEAAVTVGATNQGLVAGDLVNTAARLQSVAAPETVLVGEETRLATAEAIAYEAAGDAVLKGKSAPVTAFRALRVVGKVRGVGRSEGLEPPFVGRETEFRLLRELFHATGRERKARLVSLTGQGGIGKSRLAWEFHKYIDGVVESVWWHQGRSPSYGEGITFWALGEMVRKRAGVAETDDEATLRAGVAAALATHVTDAEERAFIEPSLHALLGLGEPPPGGRERLFAGWRTFFERIAEVGAVALVFEDLQWADDGLLDFIEHLLEWSRNFPIFIVTLARPELLDRRPTWGGARASTSLALSPLADEEMRALLASLVPGLPEAAVRSILERADGIPLYAVETVRMLVADGRLEEREGVYVPVGDLGVVEVPGSLRALVAARLDGLPADLRPIVQDASILGQTFSVEALASVAGLDHAVLEPRLRDLIRLEVFDLDTDPRSPERGQYGFVQGLLREVAYETLARRDRRARHVAAAEYFEALDDEELVGVVATHYLAAYRSAAEGPEAASIAVQAGLALRAAAERAGALGSPLQALAYLRDAIEISGSPKEVAPLEEQAARTAESAGRYAEASEHAGRAARAFAAAGDETGELRASLLEAAALSSTSFDEGSQLLRALEPRLEASSDPWLVARGALSAASLRVRAGEDTQALPLYERALALAERHGFNDILLPALSGKATLYTALGRNVESGLLLAGVAERAEREGDWETALRARNQLAFVLIDDDPRAALVVAREGLALARRLGRYSVALFLMTGVAEVALRTGDWSEAALVVQESLAGEPEGRDRVMMLAFSAVYRALLGGDPDPDLAQLAALEHKGEVWIGYYTESTPAWLAGLRGDHEANWEASTRLAELDELNAPYLWERAARAALWLGDPWRSRQAIDAVAGLGFRGRANAAALAVLQAGLAALEGRVGHAETGYRDALAAQRDLGCDGDLAFSLLDAVRFLGPGSEGGRSAAAEAEALLDRLEAAGLRPILAALVAGIPTAPTP
jgi:class 3 adenylate cyclase/tetratricopeptide (TPR) repeat protein